MVSLGKGRRDWQPGPHAPDPAAASHGRKPRSPVLPLNVEAQDGGWHEREVVVAVMTWAATRAAMIDGGEAATEALMLALDAARGQGG